jgi:hypothetical protein
MSVHTACRRLLPRPVSPSRGGLTRRGPSALKLSLTLCITLTETLARRDFQLDCRRPAATLDHLRRRITHIRPRFSCDLYQPRGVLQSAGFGGGRGNRPRRPSAATQASAGRWAHSRAFLAECTGIDCRGHRDLRGSPAPDPARLSQRCFCSRDLLRNQRHRRAARAPQTALGGQSAHRNSVHRLPACAAETTPSGRAALQGRVQPQLTRALAPVGLCFRSERHNLERLSV